MSSELTEGAVRCVFFDIRTAYVLVPEHLHVLSSGIDRDVLLLCDFVQELDTPPSTAGNGASGSVPSGSNQGSSADDSPHPSLANDALMDGSTAGKDRDRAGSVQSGVHSTSETDAAINAKKRRSPAFVRLQGGIYGGKLWNRAASALLSHTSGFPLPWICSISCNIGLLTAHDIFR